MKQVGQSVAAAKAGGVPSKEGKKHLTQLVKLIDAFKAQTDKLEAAAAHGGGAAEKHAKYMRDTVVPAMVKLRDLGDQLELIDAARDLAAADVSGNAVCEVRS